MAITFQVADISKEFGRAWHSRAALIICLALSLALHLAILIALPEPVRDEVPIKEPHALDVVMRQQAAPDVSVPAPAIVTPQPKQAQTRLPKAATEQTPREVQKPESERAPVISLSESEPLPESFPVPAASDKLKNFPAVSPQKTGVAAAGRNDAVISSPRFDAAYLRNPPPRYPLIARRNGEQGTVTLKVLVMRDGVPASVTLEKTSGSAHLDNAALETVRAWRFVPARQGPQAVEAWVLVPIVFRLEGAS